MLHLVCQKRRRPPIILLHFALPTPFLSLSLNLFERYMITYIPRVYLLASFFFFLIVFGHRRSGFCMRRVVVIVVVDESLCLTPGLFLCHLRCCLFPLILIGRSSWEGLRWKVFVGRSLSEVSVVALFLSKLPFSSSSITQS